jgi:hypothetical protein
MLWSCAATRAPSAKPGSSHPRSPTHVASLFVEAKSWRLAITHYEAAIEAAGSVQDLLQIARMHRGMGEVYRRLQQPLKARQQFDTALMFCSIESDLNPASSIAGDLVIGFDDKTSWASRRNISPGLGSIRSSRGAPPAS